MKNPYLAVLIVCLTLGPRIFGQGQPQKTTDSVSFGLEVGARAPSFSLQDQFGHKQSNKTLLGTNGTVLLFVRSADL